MEFPLAKRELVRIGRHQRTYAWRLLITVCVVGVLLYELYVFGFGSRILVTPTEANNGGGFGIPFHRGQDVGRLIFYIASMFQFVVVGLILPIFTAPALADEKRDGTLGLLLLADLRGRDVFFSKFVASFGEAVLLLVGTLPIMAFAAYFGGLSVPLMALQLSVFVVFGLAACSVGLLCSLWSRHPGNALFLTLAVLLAWQSVMVVVGWYVGWRYNVDLRLDVVTMFAVIHEPVNNANPLNLVVAQLAPAYIRVAPGIVLFLTVALVAGVLTVYLIPRHAFWRSPLHLVGPERPYHISYRRLLRESPAAPIIAAHASGFASTLRSPGMRFLIFATFGIVALVPGFGTLLILLLLCYDVSSSMISAWRSGAVDDLLMTPLSRDRLAGDIFQFHLRRSSLYGLGILVSTGQLFAVFLFIPVSHRLGVSYWDVMVESTIVQNGPAILLLVFAFAAVAIGHPYTIVSVSCLVGALGVSARRQAAVAVTVMTLVYAFSIGVSTWSLSYLLGIEYVAANPWLPALLFGLVNALLFLGVGYFAHRRFVRELGITAASRPGTFEQRIGLGKRAVQRQSA